MEEQICGGVAGEKGEEARDGEKERLDGERRSIVIVIIFYCTEKNWQFDVRHSP